MRGPLLIITNGGIGHDLRVRMEHAYLMSKGGVCRLRRLVRCFIFRSDSFVDSLPKNGKFLEAKVFEHRLGVF